MRKLLNIDGNAKTVKGLKKGWSTEMLYLAPGNLSGYEVCACSTPGCRRACLNLAGRGKFDKTQDARVWRTKFFFEDPGGFMTQLCSELDIFLARCERLGLRPCIRLNGTSDISWEDYGVPDWYPSVQFYDYTKNYNRFFRRIPQNYHLLYSRSENNEELCRPILSMGFNVAAVFRDPERFPFSYLGAPVIKGDDTDLRFLDARGCVVALKAKGPARRDTSGFVIDN